MIGEDEVDVDVVCLRLEEEDKVLPLDVVEQEGEEHHRKEGDQAQSEIPLNKTS